MNISRRWFIGSAAASLAFGGCRFFSAPAGLYSSGVPKMSFGVVSDVHILFDPKTKAVSKSADTTTFEHTLKWFRDQGVDAVVIAGDIADKGIVEELQAIADTWFKVFPNNKAPDGRTVEKIFVSGNHDMEGFKYGDFGKMYFQNPAERAKHYLVADFKGNWEKIFHEEYNTIYSKCVKGYTFIGQHWGNQGWGKNCKFDLIKPFMEKNASKIVDPSLPFFYAQHPHPKDTCYGSSVWGHDTGVVTEVLSAFPNAVAFSGHSHNTLVDDRSIWQGAFTSLGTASLRYSSVFDEDVSKVGYENKGDNSKGKFDSMKVMRKVNTYDSRQGLLVKVFADCMTIARREFVAGCSLGDEWVIPLSTAESKPYSFAEHAKKTLVPEFPCNAKVAVKKEKTTNRNKEAKQAYVVSFPKADAVESARLLDYEIRVEVEGDAKKSLVRHMLSLGHNKGTAAIKNIPEFNFKIACDLLPAGKKVRFVVSPRESFGKKGKAICSDWI
jgi:predicted phosphodiesterase